MTQQPVVSQGQIIKASRSYSDKPQLVGLPWTSDRPDAEISTRQNTTLTNDRQPYTGGIRNHNLNKQAATDPLVRQREQWDRLK
jgi:hypothetical protein